MFIETCCGRLFVELAGRGPDLVLWPALLTDGGVWFHQLRAFSERHRVVSIDPPGHGRSAPMQRRFAMDDCVRAAVEVLAAVDAQRPAWCGLSWGAMVGMWLAARDPDRLSALVLASTSARKAPWSQRLRYAVLGVATRRVGAIPPFVKQATQAMFAHPSAHSEAVRRYQRHLSGMDRRSIAHAMDAILVRRPDAIRAVGDIVVPTLVLVGADDRTIPVAESERLARAIRGAKLVTLPRAGHLSCLEAPEPFTAEVLRFLAERPSAAERRHA